MKNFSIPGKLLAASFVCVSLLASNSVAAVTNLYGDFVGTSVTYLNVRESSGTDSLPLFGAPTISGNTLTFDPTFTATAQNPLGGFDLTDGQLNLGILAAPGNAIPSVMFTELGDFSLIGAASANTYVEVAATFIIKVLKVDGFSIDPKTFTGEMSFAPDALGKFTLASFSGLGQFWSGSFSFDLNSALTSAGVSYLSGATEISVALDNTLVAVNEAGKAAFIAKKSFDGVGITVPQIPEPSVLALALCGAGLMMARRVKR